MLSPVGIPSLNSSRQTTQTGTSWGSGRSVRANSLVGSRCKTCAQRQEGDRWGRMREEEKREMTLILCYTLLNINLWAHFSFVSCCIHSFIIYIPSFKFSTPLSLFWYLACLPKACFCHLPRSLHESGHAASTEIKGEHNTDGYCCNDNDCAGRKCMKTGEGCAFFIHTYMQTKVHSTYNIYINIYIYIYIPPTTRLFIKTKLRSVDWLMSFTDTVLPNVIDNVELGF